MHDLFVPGRNLNGLVRICKCLMAWVFEKSATWRKIVKVTKQSPLAMVGFTAVCCAVPYYGGQAVLGATNPEVEPEKQSAAKEKMSMHQKVSSAHSVQTSSCC